MLKRILILGCVLAATTPLLRAQEIPTESRAGELQIGIGYSGAYPDYDVKRFYGPSFYATFDFREHIGIEADFHYLSEGNDFHGTSLDLYEKTYEIGPRYVWHIKRANPYVKLLVGRGVFNYEYSTANLAYNMYSLGAGADIRATRYLNVRLIDLEYQKWPGFPPHGLQPTVVTCGVAYRFH